MTDDQAGKKDESHRDEDVMHGRSLAGAEYGANEREQTDERERAGRVHLDEAGESMVTEAEIEAREERSDESDRSR
jgi:hypothetical protein